MDVFRAEDRASKTALKHLTSDGYDNFVSRIGLQNNNTLSAGTYVFDLITRNRVKLEAAYRGSWVVGAIVDSVAEDMTRAGINITSNESDEDIKDLEREISRLKIWNSLQAEIKWGRLYGGALGVLQIEGQDLATPLKLDSIAEGQFKGIAVFDRWQLNPVLNKVIQTGPDLGLPAYYQIVTTATSTEPDAPTATGELTVHHSRCIRYTGIDLPFFQAITELMWGESILERLWDRLIAFDNATMSAAQLVDRANLRTVGVEGFREIIAAGGPAYEGLLQMFEMMRSLQDNEGLTLIDKNDTFATTAYTFTGLPDVLLQFAQQLAGASGVPLIRLLSQSPAGLNSDGDSDIRMYYDNINAQQESKLRQPWETLLKVLWRSTFGKPMPDDLEFTFMPLWQMSDSDKATVAKTQTETALGAFEAGVTDRATTLKELRQNSGDSGMFTNISDEMITEAENEPVPIPGEEDPNAINPEIDKDGKEKEPVKNLDAKPKWYKRLFG